MCPFGTDAERKQGISGIGLGYALSAVIGPTLGSVLLLATPYAALWVAPIFLGAATFLAMRVIRAQLGRDCSAAPAIASNRTPAPEEHAGHISLGASVMLRLGLGILLWYSSNTVIILFTFFALDYFGMGISDAAAFVGAVLTISAICAMLTQIFVTRRWKQSVERLLLTGVATMVLGVVVLLIASNPMVFAIGVVCNAIGGALSMPGYTLWVTSKVTAAQQPRLAGTMEAANSAATALVPILGIAAFHLSPKLPICIALAGLLPLTFLAVSGWLRSRSMPESRGSAHD